MKLARERQHFPQHAIDAETDARLQFLGLDVDVSRPFADAEVDDRVEHLDQRDAFGEGGELFGRIVGAVEKVDPFERVEVLADVLVVGIMDGDRILDLPRRGEHRADRQLGDLA